MRFAFMPTKAEQFLQSADLASLADRLLGGQGLTASPHQILQAIEASRDMRYEVAVLGLANRLLQRIESEAKRSDHNLMASALSALGEIGSSKSAEHIRRWLEEDKLKGNSEQVAGMALKKLDESRGSKLSPNMPAPNHETQSH